MFTGIIQGQGEILDIQGQGTERRFSIRLLFPTGTLTNGESIAVNGVCLSVEHHQGEQFTAYASSETITRTTLGNLRRGSRVNLERALAVGDRLGGHIVSGHVDCIAQVQSMTPAGQSLCIRCTFPQKHAAEVIPKGSVTLDGISLTINECGSDFLTVNVIPDTQGRTTVGNWCAGACINMETDIIGKYVHSFLAPRHEDSQQASSSLTKEFLLQNGFL